MTQPWAIYLLLQLRAYHCRVDVADKKRLSADDGGLLGSDGVTVVGTTPHLEMDRSEAMRECGAVDGRSESWSTKVKYSSEDDDDSLDDCMTMLDLAMEKLDRVTQDLYLPEAVDADCDRSRSISADVKSLDLRGDIPSESYVQNTNCREEALPDLFSVSDEAMLNFVQFSNVFPT